MSSRTAGISLLLLSTSTCPRTMPESCSTAATIIRRPSSVCFEAPRRSFPWRQAHVPAVLAGPLTDGVVQGLGRQRGEDVVEGGDCGRGVALLARAPERTHCLDLLLGEQGGGTGRTRSHLGSRPDGQRRRSPERCSAGSACPGHGGTRAPRPDTRTGCAAAAPPLARCVAQRQCAGTSVRLIDPSGPRRPPGSSSARKTGFPAF